MKGHGHAWDVQSVSADGRSITARVVAGDKPLDDNVLSLALDEHARHWRGGSASTSRHSKPASGCT